MNGLTVAAWFLDTHTKRLEVPVLVAAALPAVRAQNLYPRHLSGFKYPVKEIRGIKYRFGIINTCQDDSGAYISDFGDSHASRQDLFVGLW